MEGRGGKGREGGDQARFFMWIYIFVYMYRGGTGAVGGGSDDHPPNKNKTVFFLYRYGTQYCS